MRGTRTRARWGDEFTPFVLRHDQMSVIRTIKGVMSYLLRRISKHVVVEVLGSSNQHQMMERDFGRR